MEFYAVAFDFGLTLNFVSVEQGAYVNKSAPPQ